MHQAPKMLLTAAFFQQKPRDLLNLNNINWQLKKWCWKIIVSLFMSDQIPSYLWTFCLTFCLTRQILENPPLRHNFPTWRLVNKMAHHFSSVDDISLWLKFGWHSFYRTNPYFIRIWPEKCNFSRVRLESWLIFCVWDKCVSGVRNVSLRSKWLNP